MAITNDTILTEWNFKTGSSAKNIDEVVKSIRKAERETKKYQLVQKSLGKTTSRFSTIANGFKGALTNVASGFNIYGMAIGGAINITKEFWNESTQLAGALGDYTGDLEAAVAATDNFAKALDIANARNRLNAQDMAVSDKQWTSMLANLKRLSQTMGIDVKQAIDSAQKAMGEGRYRIAAKIGVVYDINEAYESYAITLGKAKNELTELEKKQANQIAFLNQLKNKAEELGPTSSNLSEHMTAFWNTLSNEATIELARFNGVAGEAITKLLNMGKETNYAAEGMSTAAVQLKALNDGQKLGNRLLKQYKKTMAEEDFGSEKYQNAVNNYNRLLAIMDKGYEKQRRLKDQIEKENKAQKDLNKTLKEQADLRISLMLGYEDKSQKSFLPPTAKVEPPKKDDKSSNKNKRKAPRKKKEEITQAEIDELRAAAWAYYAKGELQDFDAAIPGNKLQDVFQNKRDLSGQGLLGLVGSVEKSDQLQKINNDYEAINKSVTAFGLTLQKSEDITHEQYKKNNEQLREFTKNITAAQNAIRLQKEALTQSIANAQSGPTDVINLGKGQDIGSAIDQMFLSETDNQAEIRKQQQELALLNQKESQIKSLSGTLNDYKKTNQGAMKESFNVTEMAVGQMNTLLGSMGNAIWSAADASVRGGEAMGLAMKKALKNTLLMIAQEATVKALFAAGEAILTWNPEMAVAAGFYGSAAILAGGGAMAISNTLPSLAEDPAAKIRKEKDKAMATTERTTYGTKRDPKTEKINVNVYMGDVGSPSAALLTTKQIAYQVNRQRSFNN